MLIRESKTALCRNLLNPYGDQTSYQSTTVLDVLAICRQSACPDAWR